MLNHKIYLIVMKGSAVGVRSSAFSYYHLLPEAQTMYIGLIASSPFADLGQFLPEPPQDSPGVMHRV